MKPGREARRRCRRIREEDLEGDEKRMEWNRKKGATVEVFPPKKTK